MPTREQVQSLSGALSSPATYSNFAVGSNSNRTLVVLMGGRNDTNPFDITSVVFNSSEAFTLRGEAWLDEFTNQHVEIWTLDNPTNTTANVVITWTGGDLSVGKIYIVEYSGANNGIGTNVGVLAAATTNLYVDVDTDASGNILVGSLTSQVNDGWPLSAQGGTTIVDEDGTNRSALFQNATTGGAADRIGATASTARRSALVAIELLAAGGAAPTRRPSGILTPKPRDTIVPVYNVQL